MNTFKGLLQKDQLTLVDFFATWCGPCQMLTPVLEEVKKELGDTLTILKIDVDKNPALTTEYSTKYQMRGVPTLMLFKKGKLLWKQSGYMDKDTLLRNIEQHKNNYWHLKPLYARGFFYACIVNIVSKSRFIIK